MPDPATPPHATPPGATLHLGGQAWAAPALEPLLVNITDVHPFPGNPRRHDQDNITASIRDLGLYAAVTVQESTGYTMVGNGRRQALLDLGATRIPRTMLNVDDTRARAIVARDNQTSDASGNDDRLLLDLLAPLADDTDLLALAGFTTDGLDDLQRAVENEEFAAAANGATGTPVSDLSPPIDLDGDTERVTVTVDAGSRQTLYALLDGKAWVRDIADAHTRKPA